MVILHTSIFLEKRHEHVVVLGNGAGVVNGEDLRMLVVLEVLIRYTNGKGEEQKWWTSRHATHDGTCKPIPHSHHTHTHTHTPNNPCTKPSPLTPKRWISPMKINNGLQVLSMPCLKNHCLCGVSFVVSFTKRHPFRLQSFLGGFWMLVGSNQPVQGSLYSIMSSPSANPCRNASLCEIVQLGPSSLFPPPRPLFGQLWTPPPLMVTCELSCVWCWLRRRQHNMQHNMQHMQITRVKEKLVKSRKQSSAPVAKRSVGDREE